jgi:hypothetical protein
MYLCRNLPAKPDCASSPPNKDLHITVWAIPDHKEIPNRLRTHLKQTLTMSTPHTCGNLGNNRFRSACLANNGISVSWTGRYLLAPLFRTPHSFRSHSQLNDGDGARSRSQQRGHYEAVITTQSSTIDQTNGLCVLILHGST